MATATSLDIETLRAPARRRTSRFRLFDIKKRKAKASPNSAELITNMLCQRVRIALSDGVRWMTGYEALSLLLFDRVGRGDAHAGELLALLVKYPVPTGNRQLALDGAVAPRTPAENQLAKAFAQRMLDGGSVNHRRRVPA